MKNVLFIAIWMLLACSCSVAPPTPYGVLPSKKQMDWHQMEYYMFIHFGMNTFTDKEWGDGAENPINFNPTDVDCRQWASIAKAAGMKGIIITAKHHDGFCLWPSEYSTHTVRESPWKEGKGDLLKELSEACKEYDLKFGVYLSPWDQNHPDYGTDAYNQVFANTLTEVLTSYGDVFEQWFDGANGEGPNGKLQVYDWPLFHKTVYKYQPKAMIFSDIGPDCRWMGNERGIAAETNWSRLSIDGFGPGKDAPSIDTLQQGNIYGTHWVPAETDVSIRPGWFYSDATNDKVKTVDQLVDIYYTSIGRNSNLLLNVPPDRRGRIHPTDSARLIEFRQAIDEAFADDLALDATITATNSRGGAYDASRMNDGDYQKYWAANEDARQASIEVDFGKSQAVNQVLIQEHISLGQRIQQFSVHYYNEGEWEPCAEGTTVGYKRILRFPTVETTKLRIDIEASLACPLINTISVYHAPERIISPAISRDKNGVITLAYNRPGYTVYYTTDSSEPMQSSIRYEQPFEHPQAVTIRAVAIHSDGSVSRIAKHTFDLAPVDWRVVSPAIQEADVVIDGDEKAAIAIPIDEPVIVDLGKSIKLNGFTYTPEGRSKAENIYRYTFLVSEDGKQWSTIKDNQPFDNIENNPIKQRVLFDAPQRARYIQLKASAIINDASSFKIAELGVLTE